jgi:hypothetical protein
VKTREFPSTIPFHYIIHSFEIPVLLTTKLAMHIQKLCMALQCGNSFRSTFFVKVFFPFFRRFSVIFFSLADNEPCNEMKSKCEGELEIIDRLEFEYRWK